MLVRLCRYNAPLLCPVQKPRPVQIRLVHIFYSHPFFPDGSRYRIDPDRSSLEPFNDRSQDLPIQTYQSHMIDAQRIQGFLRDIDINDGFPFTWKKSRTRFSIRLATRGVPRERLAISSIDCSSAVTPRSSAERPMIFFSSSVVYISNLQLTPKRSLRGAERIRVVAPISVNFAISSRIDRAEGLFR